MKENEKWWKSIELKLTKGIVLQPLCSPTPEPYQAHLPSPSENIIVTLLFLGKTVVSFKSFGDRFSIHCTHHENSFGFQLSFKGSEAANWQKRFDGVKSLKCVPLGSLAETKKIHLESLKIIKETKLVGDVWRRSLFRSALR